MPIEKQLFKSILGGFAAGVTIITTVGEDGSPYGLTATAFSSVSLDPPLVLVCIDKKAESHPHLVSAGRFSVSLLAAGQEALSNRFAKSGGDKFDGIETLRGEGGLLRPAGTLGHLDCKVVQAVDAGDHTVFIGLVEEGANSDASPLLYFRGAYRTVG